MRILLPTLHVRHSAQAVSLAAGNLKACLPEDLQQQTELLDLFPEQTLEQMANRILARQPQLIAFPLYLWNRQQILLLCRHLRNQHPDLYLLAGGPEASADTAAVIAEGALDGAICGEGELAFAQLVSSLQRGEPAANIPGFLPADKSSQSVAAAICPDLSKLPSPWITGILPLTPGSGVLWEVARGCAFNCAFCYDAKGQHGVRPLPLERLQAELELFVANRVSQIWILDSTFNAPAERGKQLLRMLIDQAPQIHFHIEAKADFLDEETAALLSQLSCSVQIGLQTADPQVLRSLHRNLQPGKMTRSLQHLSNAGVTFGLDLIYGLPGDNHQGFRTSLDFALQHQPNQIDIFPLAVLPGTELHQRQTEFGISADPQPPYLIQHTHSYSAAELEQSQQLATATDILYNRGRAVGFFLQFCEALAFSPVELLEEFSRWLNSHSNLDNEQKTVAEHWQPVVILPLHQEFFTELFRKRGKEKLLALAEDLINYHYCCAEVLLSEECQPRETLPADRQLLKACWQLNPAVRIQKFNYDLQELEEVGGEKLSWQTKQLTAESSYGIFLQQQGQPVIEALENDFAQLLLKADGQKTAQQLTANFDQQTALELLHFAVGQGLLLPTT